MRIWIATALLVGACHTWQDPQGVQLPLFGDRMCSDPVFDQIAAQCCTEHDVCFAVGGTENDYHLCNHEFAACLHLWGVPSDIAEARFNAVERFGYDSFRWSDHRTRGPPR